MMLWYAPMVPVGSSAARLCWPSPWITEKVFSFLSCSTVPEHKPASEQLEMMDWWNSSYYS
eukprot:3743251-Rhodomonas_salina.1